MHKPQILHKNIYEHLNEIFLMLLVNRQITVAIDAVPGPGGSKSIALVTLGLLELKKHLDCALSYMV